MEELIAAVVPGNKLHRSPLPSRGEKGPRTGDPPDRGPGRGYRNQGLPPRAEIVQAQPEFADCVKASQKTRIPLKEIMRLALKEHEGKGRLRKRRQGVPMNLKKIAGGVRLILEGVGEDPDRPGIKGTPRRVGAMLQEILGGTRRGSRERISGSSRRRSTTKWS